MSSDSHYFQIITHHPTSEAVEDVVHYRAFALALLSVSAEDKSVPTGQEARIPSQQPNFCRNTNIYTPAKLMFQHKFDLEQHPEGVGEEPFPRNIEKIRM